MVFSLEPQERRVFELIGQCAGDMGIPAYVVGGYVRDRLLGRTTKDIDVVCVGEGIALAELVASKLSPRPKVSFFKRFGTAMLRCDGIELEFVGARRESYMPESRKRLSHKQSTTQCGGRVYTTDPWLERICEGYLLAPYASLLRS
jgi:tRNA nucleotidyltransferase/poly(A) polymerase